MGAGVLSGLEGEEDSTNDGEAEFWGGIGIPEGSVGLLSDMRKNVKYYTVM